MTAGGRARIALLASGGGSNFGAIATHLEQLGDSRRADIVAVASDRRGAGVLERARSGGIEAVQLHSATAPAGEQLDAFLERTRPDLVVLAGYLRLIPDTVAAAWRGRMINVHPALLPAFGGPGMYGMRVHRAVLAAGARISGPTVHFVDEVYDHGAIIAQWPVPVHVADTAESLAARVLRAEHALYPRVVHAVAAGATSLGGDGRVHFSDASAPADLEFMLRSDPAPGSPALATIASLYPNL